MKPEWGTKHECPSCGAHFYDMRKPDASCPKCQTPVNDEAALLAKTQDIGEAPPEKPHDILDDFEDVETDLDEGSGEGEFLEDTSELVGSDESDLSEVMEHIDDGVTDQNM